MDYAIILRFDSESERRLNGIINAIVQHGVNRYMLDTQIPPHVTIAYFETETITPILDVLSDYCDTCKPGDVYWASLGAFAPAVLFAAPVLSEYLLNACIETNRLTAPHAAPGDHGHYLPYQWVPHTALAVRLNQEELNRAFGAALQQFSAFGGTITGLTLAQCNPYKEVRTWTFSLCPA